MFNHTLCVGLTPFYLPATCAYGKGMNGIVADSSVIQPAMTLHRKLSHIRQC